jgi:peroxiredoxin
VPKLKEIRDELKDNKDFVIIGVHTKLQANKMPAFIEKQGMDWPICVDEEGETAKAYKVEGYPTYVIIDKKGIVRKIRLGGHPEKSDVDPLLKE